MHQWNELESTLNHHERETRLPRAHKITAHNPITCWKMSDVDLLRGCSCGS